MNPFASIHPLLFLGLLLCAWARPVRGAAFGHDHRIFTAILTNVVRDGRVDYAALKSDSVPLARYLDTLAAVPQGDFKGWGESNRLAFLINLYNAATLKLVADHYPVASIKDIGGWFSGPWKQKVVRVFGETTTLDHIEHDILRREYKEPRIHFALVCAAKGCPPLRPEAFVASRLDAQLLDQGRLFLAQKEKNRVDAADHVVYLSPIFKWFEEDFERKSGSVLKFLGPFLDQKDRAAMAKGDLKIRYTDYDWTLNNRSGTTAP